MSGFNLTALTLILPYSWPQGSKSSADVHPYWLQCSAHCFCSILWPSHRIEVSDKLMDERINLVYLSLTFSMCVVLVLLEVTECE